MEQKEVSSIQAWLEKKEKKELSEPLKEYKEEKEGKHVAKLRGLIQKHFHITPRKIEYDDNKFFFWKDLIQKYSSSYRGGLDDLLRRDELDIKIHKDDKISLKQLLLNCIENEMN